MAHAVKKKMARKRRHLRVRKKISGNAKVPRLNVYRSLKHIYAQLIDDLSGRTLVFASSLDPSLQDQLKKPGKQESARLVGELLAQRALQNGIEQAVFDRGGYRYHGRIKALADEARNKGLKF